MTGRSIFLAILAVFVIYVLAKGPSSGGGSHGGGKHGGGHDKGGHGGDHAKH